MSPGKILARPRPTGYTLFIIAVSGKEAGVQASHKVRQDLIDTRLVEHTDKCN